MRDILVTPDNAGRQEMFSFAHIERMAALRKPRRGRKTAARLLQDPLVASVDGRDGLHQTAAGRVGRLAGDEGFMTLASAGEAEPAFIEVGAADGRRRIAVRAREGGGPDTGLDTGPGLFWLGGFNSDMKGTKALALDAWAVERKRACVRFDYSGHGDRKSVV